VIDYTMIFLVNRGLGRGKIYRPVKATGHLPPLRKKAGRSFRLFSAWMAARLRRRQQHDS